MFEQLHAACQSCAYLSAASMPKLNLDNGLRDFRRGFRIRFDFPNCWPMAPRIACPPWLAVH
jgi:hypothetical protein